MKQRLKQNRESGVVHVAMVLLIIIILGAIVGGAWYVWQKKSKNDSSTSSAQNSDQKKEEPKISIPEGWKLYKNTEASFSFYYPPEWGSVSQTQSKSLQFSALKGLEFQANRRDKKHTDGHFGTIQLNNVINVLTKNDSASVVFVEGSDQSTREEVLAKDKIVKTLPNSHACVLDEVSVYEAYMNDPELINSYVYFGYCGSAYGAISFTSGSLDITDSKTQKFKEEMTKLLQTFETF